MRHTTSLAALSVLLTACFNPDGEDLSGGSTSLDPSAGPSTGPGMLSSSTDPTTGVDPTTTGVDPTTTGVDPTLDPDSGSTASQTTGPIECDPGMYGPDCTGVCDCNGGECADGMDGDGSCMCPPDTYGPDCAGVCSCNGGECNGGALGDGSCTCLPDTYGPDCAGVCGCGPTACDDGAMGTGNCLCPNPGGTFNVAYLPGWGQRMSDAALAYSEIQSDWMAYGPCAPVFTELPNPFTGPQLIAADPDVILVANPSGTGIEYSPAEVAAIEARVTGGNAGIVATYLIRSGADNSVLGSLLGLDPLGHLATGSHACDPVVDVLVPAHPLATNLPLNFNLVPGFANAQDMGQPWADAMLPGAEVIMESADQRNVVIAFEGPAWRGTRLSTFPEYQSSVEGRQAVYNALLWSAFPP